MPMESADFEEVLQEALTERDMQLQEKELPEINIGEALPVKDGWIFSGICGFRRVRSGRVG